MGYLYSMIKMKMTVIILKVRQPKIAQSNYTPKGHTLLPIVIQ